MGNLEKLSFLRGLVWNSTLMDDDLHVQLYCKTKYYQSVTISVASLSPCADEVTSLSPDNLYHPYLFTL